MQPGRPLDTIYLIQPSLIDTGPSGPRDPHWKLSSRRLSDQVIRGGSGDQGTGGHRVKDRENNEYSKTKEADGAFGIP